MDGPMNEVLILAIGFGLTYGLLFAEMFSLSAGGLVVPGYVAVFLHQPRKILVLVALSLAAWGMVRALSWFLMIYGKRRTALMILVGYLLSFSLQQYPWPVVFGNWVSPDVIGYILPGLMANWFDRQGPGKTLCTLFIIAVLVRLSLIGFLGVDVHS